MFTKTCQREQNKALDLDFDFTAALGTNVV